MTPWAPTRPSIADVHLLYLVTLKRPCREDLKQGIQVDIASCAGRSEPIAVYFQALTPHMASDALTGTTGGVWKMGRQVSPSLLASKKARPAQASRIFRWPLVGRVSTYLFSALLQSLSSIYVISDRKHQLFFIFQFLQGSTLSS